jgi:hypothetical protein
MDFEDIPNAEDENEMLSPPPAVPENNVNYDSVYETNDNILPDPEPQQEDHLT